MKREYIVYETCYNGLEKVYNPIYRMIAGNARAAFNGATKALGIEYSEITRRAGNNWYIGCGYNPKYQQTVTYEIIG